MSTSVSVQPNKRYRFGRRLALFSAGIFALSRALYYIPNPRHAEIQPAIQFISGPASVWVWVTLWGVVALLCFRDLFRKNGVIGISLLVGAMMLWGSAYLISFVGTVVNEGFGSREWFTFCTYVCGAGIILGGLKALGSLKGRRD